MASAFLHSDSFHHFVTSEKFVKNIVVGNVLCTTG